MKKEKYIVKTFSALWWFWVAIAALLTYLLTKWTNMQESEEKKRILILSVSIFEFVYLLIYKISLKDIRENYNFLNELPCYLCNQSTILCIIAAVRPYPALMGYLTSVGLFGAALAFLMPDGPNQNLPFFSKQTLGFYGYHCLLVATCLSFFTSGLYTPQYSDIPWFILIIFILIVIAHLLNFIMRQSNLNPHSNFIFTYSPDNPVLNALYKRFPVRLFYLVPLGIPIALLSLSEFFFLRLFS